MTYDELTKYDFPMFTETKRGGNSVDADAQFKAIYDEAQKAGMASFEACKPMPMVVGTPSTVFGNDIDTTKRMYYVEGGVCGFAFIRIKPARSAFAKWLKATGKAQVDDYHGGLVIFVGVGGQSMERKAAYARGFASVLRKHNIPVQVETRMD